MFCAGAAAIVGAPASASPGTGGTGPVAILALTPEISGDCGSVRTVSVAGDVNRGMANAPSPRVTLLLETTVSYSQDGVPIGEFTDSIVMPPPEDATGTRVPWSITLGVPAQASGVVEVTAMTNLFHAGNRLGKALQSATRTELLDVGEDPVEALSNGLTLGAVTAADTVLNRGDKANISWSLANTSGRDLCVPTDSFFPQFHTVGVFQAWIKRLGPDSEIPSVPPIILRDAEGRYAAGGSLVATEGFLADPALWPSGVEQSFSDTIPFLYGTEEFPPGDYRIYVEFRSRNFFELVHSSSVDVEFQ